jgi:hypothetical protein
MGQHPTPRNIAVRRSKSGPSCDAPSTSTESPPIPVGSLPLMLRYYPLPPQSLDGSARSITTSLIRPISTIHTSSLPSIRIDHVELSQQVQRKSLSRAAQRRYESNLQRARSESLAALTAVHPGSCRYGYASPLSLNGPRQASVSTSQHHGASLRHGSHSNRNHRPPPQYDSLLSSTFNETATEHRVPLSSKHRAVPRSESLARWKAESEESRSTSNSMRCADTNEEVRRVNETELERKEELTKKGKRGDGVGLQNVRGCFGGAMRWFGVRL